MLAIIPVLIAVVVIVVVSIIAFVVVVVAAYLLETISEGLRVTLDQAPSREHAVLGSTVVLASGRHAGGSCQVDKQISIGLSTDLYRINTTTYTVFRTV